MVKIVSLYVSQSLACRRLFPMDPPLALCFGIPPDLNKGDYILQRELAKNLLVHLNYDNILILRIQSRIWLCSREEKKS